jgi:hypothetical protein
MEIKNIDYTEKRGGKTIFAKMNDDDFYSIIIDFELILSALMDDFVAAKKYSPWFFRRNKFFGMGEKNRTQMPIEFIAGVLSKKFQRIANPHIGDFSVPQLKMLTCVMTKIGWVKYNFKKVTYTSTVIQHLK